MPRAPTVLGRSPTVFSSQRSTSQLVSLVVLVTTRPPPPHSHCSKWPASLTSSCSVNRDNNNDSDDIITYIAQCLHGLALQYLSGYIQHVADSNRRHLQSLSSLQLVIWHTRLSTAGDHVFPVAGSRLWNSLPPDITSAPTLTVFQKPQNFSFPDHFLNIFGF